MCQTLPALPVKGCRSSFCMLTFSFYSPPPPPLPLLLPIPSPSPSPPLPLSSPPPSSPSPSLSPFLPLPPPSSPHAGSDGLVQLWDIGSGNVVKEFKGHSEVTSLAYSPDGTLLASSCHGNQIRVWNMRTANVLPVASIGLGCGAVWGMPHW